MKTKTTLKSSTLALTLGLLATSGPLIADGTQGLWGEQFQAAYNEASAQASTAGPSDLPFWAGHFEEAYMSSMERSAFASFTAASKVATGGDTTTPRSDSVIDHLLWRSKYPR